MTRIATKSAGDSIQSADANAWTNKIQNGSDFDLNIARVIYPTGFTSTRIQNAVSSLHGKSGTVRLSTGTYSLGTVITLSTGATLLGNGWDTYLRLNDGAANGISTVCVYSNGNYVTVKDLRLDGNRTNQAATIYSGGISLSTFDFCKVIGCIVEHVHDDAIGFQGDDCVIFDCVSRDTDRGEGIYAQSTVRASIIDCLIDSPATFDGISLRYGSYPVVSRNRILNAPDSGIRLEGITNAQILDNRIFNSTTHGITATIFSGIRPDRAIIRGNKIVTPVGKGITLASCFESQIVENWIDGTGQVGSVIPGIWLAPGKRTKIRGNYIFQMGRGIYLDTGSDDSEVSGNTIDGNGQSGAGIMISSSLNPTVYGNIVKNCGQAGAHDIGIRFADFGAIGAITGITCIGNRCFDDQGASQTQNYGIQLDANVTQATIESNSVSGNIFGGILNSASNKTSILVARNAGYNPVGMSTFTINTSPYTYTNNDSVIEYVTIYGGTTSSFVRDGITVGTSSPFSTWLEPGQKIKVVYSSTPSGVKDRK